MTDQPSHMHADFDTDVAVIGYGPSGLAASLKLAHHGIRVMAFEKERSIYPRARAVTVNDWTMRCFQSLGLDEALAKTMDPTAALRWVTYDRQELMRVDFPPSKFGRHPRSYAIYQPAMEEVLRSAGERLAPALSVHYGTEVVGLKQDHEGAELEVRDLASGQTRTVGEGQDPVWGADSRHLIFASGGSLILLDTQTGQRTTLVSGLGRISEPTWSR